MFWYLLAASVSIGYIVRGFGEVLVGLLLLVRQAFDDILGERAAGAVTLLAIIGIAIYAARAYSASDMPSSPGLSATQAPARAERPERPRAAATQQRAQSRCGRGRAPDAVEPDAWRRYRCARAADGCVSWDAYASRSTQGCPGRSLCCPPRDMAPSALAPDAGTVEPSRSTSAEPPSEDERSFEVQPESPVGGGSDE